MRQPKTATPLAGAFSVRTIIIAALAVALVLIAGQARPVLAVNEGGTFSFAATELSVDEGDSAQLPVVHTGRTDTTASGNVSLGVNIQLITAEASDIGNSGADFCFPVQGAVSVPFSIPVGTNADADGDDETFSVTLTLSSGSVPCASGNAVVGGPDTITVTINDTGGGDGDATFRFALASSQFNDDEGLVNAVVTRSGDTSGTDTVECLVSGGTATGGGNDYTFSPAVKVLTFNPGITSRNCSITLIENGDGPTETVVLSLDDPSAGATIGSPDDHILTIIDSGTEVIQFSQPSYTVDEDGGTASFTVTRTNPDGDDIVVCRTVEIGGEADEDVDYQETDDVLNFTGSATSRTCTVPIIPDALIEGNETFRLTLEIDSGNAELGPNDDVIVTIVDGDGGEFEFATTTSTVAEGNVATLTVLRGGDLDGTASVECNVTGGTAELADYDVIDGIANFANNVSTSTCLFFIEEDGDTDASETLIVTLQDPVNGSIGTPSQHTITIIQSNQVYTFEEATYTVAEGAGTVTVTVERSTSAGTGQVDWDITGGTATAGSDYVNTQGTVNFTAGQTQRTFSITILATPAAEANETIIVELEDPVNGTLGTPSLTTITITETGLPTVTDVNPDDVPTAGGTSVVITGTNFTGATAVTFGAVNATSFVINNSTQITAVTPARNAGTYDVRVTTPSGTSANTANDDITYGAAETVTYQLSVRWSLIAWLGVDDASIAAALQGTVSLSSSQSQTAPNNIYSVVTAVATWDNPTQRYLFWFPTGGSVPGANDITTFNYGTPYWIAVTTAVNWTVVEGP